jgi:hypothetical protein
MQCRLKWNDTERITAHNEVDLLFDLFPSSKGLVSLAVFNEAGTGLKLPSLLKELKIQTMSEANGDQREPYKELFYSRNGLNPSKTGWNGSFGCSLEPNKT